ncbi:uracil-DNA glycosylase family protein [Sansalvadorimonas verongulae]|uniref:uracil-DNA glycosylase family protein n=1 Tax=Sansalvadorimonas verongulae TaxID=2172824 RepID=UPI0012BBB0FD|nr:uracil-DNA glycosylase family protein [Sansalvadorimonas verongulae]MTI12863.1 uracil-DNA glycosylase family protein [Sansalvadorimonas verongulae]
MTELMDRSGYITLLDAVRQCTLCEPHLPLGPRPVLQFHPDAKILIAGQAPGRKVHETGLPFNDPSGDRLREWLGVTREQFYDPKLFAIIPMGFCYPGTGKSGDLPPRPECAQTWRARLLEQLPNVQMTLVLGQYAQAYHFGTVHKTVTELVQSWQRFWPDKVPLPHPSPRNNLWLRRNSWFETEIIPEIKKQVCLLL